MKKTTIHRFILVSFAFTLIIILNSSFPSGKSGSVIAKKDQMQAGMTQVNITPEKSMPMSGYAGRADGFTGIRDSLFASVLVFAEGGEQSCIITADLIGFSHKYYDELTTKISKASGIPARNIFLIAAHNHGGPTTRVYGSDGNKTIEGYMTKFTNQVVSAVESAKSQMKVVKIGYGTGECKMNINRRCKHPEGGVWLGKNPYGICDHEVSVVRIDDMESNPMALLVNWACHATVNGQGNNQITGDWPGATARIIKKEMGDDLVTAITAGASGDIDPIYGPDNDFNHIDEIGLRMGEEVVRIAKGIETAPQNGIKVMQEELMVPGKERNENRMPEATLKPADDVMINLSAMKLGDVIITGISAEVMTEMGLQIKAFEPNQPIMVMTHCNGSSGYVCTDEAYKQGGYEPMTSRTMPGVEDAIVTGMQKLVAEIE